MAVGRLLAGNLRAAGTTALLFGVPIGCALGLWTAVLNDFGVAGALATSGYLVALYSAIFLLGLCALALIAGSLGRETPIRLLAALSLAGVFLLNALLRYNLAIQFASVVPHMTWLGVFNFVALTGASGLLLVGLLQTRVSTAARWVAGTLVLSGAVHAMNAAREEPVRIDIATEIPAVLDGAPSSLRAAKPFVNARMVVLGFDGLSFDVLLPALRAGLVPNFAALLGDAAYGYLDTISHTVSPVVWETISTGRPSSAHGIGYHVHFELPGVADRVRHLPQFYRGNTPMLIRRLLTGVSPIAPWSRQPSGSIDAKVARFYDVVTSEGVSVGVFNWMNSGPAYPTNGWIRGFGPSQPRTYPEDLLEGLPELPPTHGALQPGSPKYIRDRVPYEIALYERFRRIALSRPADLLMYYTHFHDAVNHLNWRDEAHGKRFFISGAKPPEFEIGEAGRLGLELLDDIVGDVLARIGEDTILVIVSDHGFDFRGLEHDNGPPGVFIARGRGLRPGPIEGASIHDVAPTLLHWLDLPTAEDMDGEPLDLAEPGGRLDRRVERIASYGPALLTTEAQAPNEDELREHEEYLRSLGYVN